MFSDAIIKYKTEKKNYLMNYDSFVLNTLTLIPYFSFRILHRIICIHQQVVAEVGCTAGVALTFSFIKEFK